MHMAYVRFCTVLYTCKWFFSTAISCSVHRFPGCLEPIRCRRHVGSFWRCKAGPSRCVRPRRHLCQVLNHLQPDGLPVVQAQLSRVSLQRHVSVETEVFPGEPTFGSEGPLRTHLTAQQGHERLHAPFKWTAGQLRGMSAVQ